MTIEKNVNGTELTLTLVGRLDTTTAPHLETEIKQSAEGVEKLVEFMKAFAAANPKGE